MRLPQVGLTPARAAIVVAAIGVLVTVVITLTAWTLDRNNEHRLLEVQTRQAGAVLASTILSISEPLSTALQIETATGGNLAQFAGYMSSYAGPGRLFVSASLWQGSGASPHLVATVGLPPALPPASITATDFIERALRAPTFVVTSVDVAGLQRVGYAIADPHSPAFVIYAERSIPANRQVAVESNPAFSDLDYATYIGPTSGLSGLATTDVPVSRLPIAGDTARDVIPFGDTTLTLVAAARGHLGGTLGAELPWIFLVGGSLVTIATAVTAERLVRRRQEAERDAQTISGLYERLDDLYGEQRSIAETLQAALLPAYNPAIANLEIASRYVAGAVGVDVGGDWYSLVEVDEQHFAFAVGDVSGRGISAATVMAQLRFTIRAYLLEGHRPEAVLEMCSKQLELEHDGHFATVIVGVGDLDSREVAVANAGHLNPLILSGTGAEYLETRVGIPLGVAPTSYVASTLVMAPGSALVAFTDGLVERRGEDIDAGLARLARAASTPQDTLDSLLTSVVAELADGSEDDLAVLAFRWR